MANGLPLYAALVGGALLATTVIVGAGNALATPKAVAAPAPVVTVAAPLEAPAPACLRKVRVVYGGYADTAAGCASAR